MHEFLGIDTSNYTTSAAIYVSEEHRIIQAKKLLPVKDGQLGLRQSDAVFHHTKQLPGIMEELFAAAPAECLSAVAASVRPRNTEGSYMPCFLCGETAARSISAAGRISFYPTSHQTGHILAALYSADRLDLVRERSIAFHVSGGTTDCLLCEPDDDSMIKVKELGTSLDLKAGQAVDRTGIMLGLKFPCGRELERLACGADKTFRLKPVIKNGNCCLSGVENKCREMLEKGERPENIAMFCLMSVGESILAMTRSALENCGDLPVIFAGGVMSDMIIREHLAREIKRSYFAAPEFSCDNAAGAALYGYLKYMGVEKCL